MSYTFFFFVTNLVLCIIYAFTGCPVMSEHHTPHSKRSGFVDITSIVYLCHLYM